MCAVVAQADIRDYIELDQGEAMNENSKRILHVEESKSLQQYIGTILRVFVKGQYSEQELIKAVSIPLLTC